jgi:hypothetical protein
MSAYLYVYGVTRAGAEPPAGLPVVGGEGALSVVTFGALGALVSPIAEPEVMSSRRHMMAHTKAIEAAMAEMTLLPMRFGIIVDGPENIRAALAPKEADLLALIADLDGCVEAGVRASWNDRVLFSEIAAARPDIARKAEALGKLNPTAAYYDRIELGREVDSAMAVKRFDERKALVARLAPLAIRHVNLPEGDDMNVMNVALLIRRADEAALVAAIEAIDRDEGDRLNLKIVSPAPLYNFVKLRLTFAPPSEPMKGAA